MELVNQDGGLTALGYVLAIAAIVLALGLAVFFTQKRNEKAISVKRLVFGAAALSIAYVLSFVKLFPLPTGGSVTLCSMLFVVLIGYWYGPRTGLLTAFVYGMLQFLQGPYVISFLQVGCDYLFAFTCLGLAGFFKGKKHGLVIGYLISVLARAAFHALGGYLFWMEYMPEDFPAALAWAYPVIYNFGYIIAEAAITVIILAVPAVKKGIARITDMARKA